MVAMRRRKFDAKCIKELVFKILQKPKWRKMAKVDWLWDAIKANTGNYP